ncbi:MAG: outer membrane protein transport protein [Gammaproteobacteria bacterium]|nr:outer membrane protein transport protein [Gammaproteobacteria bacterium]
MRVRLNQCLLGILSLSVSTVLWASGFQNNEAASSYLGTAFSGTAASAYDASTAFYNPAGIMQLNKHQAMASGTYIHGDFDYTHTSGTIPTGPAGANNLTGKQHDDPAVPSVLPAIHYTNPLTDRWGVGFSITSPFGLATEYDMDAIQRYHATRSELITIDLNPSLAYQATPWLSAGVGVSAQYLRAKLNNASRLADAAGDFESKITADDWGPGWNVGLLARFNQERTKVGLAYRSKINYDLKGKAKFEGAGVAAAPTVLVPQHVNGRVTLPETITASLSQSLNPQWDLLVDVAYTNWSRFKKLRINFPETALPDTITPQNYEDTWRYSVGTNYRLTDNWAVRAGYMYDNSPVRNRHRTSRLPDSDRQWLAVGFQYRTNSQKVVFDVGYAHVFFENNIPVNETAPLNAATGAVTSFAAINGKYDGKADLLGVQVAWNI